MLNLNFFCPNKNKTEVVVFEHPGLFNQPGGLEGPLNQFFHCGLMLFIYLLLSASVNLKVLYNFT